MGKITTSLIYALFAAIIILPLQDASAGELDNFEKSATKSTHHNKKTNYTSFDTDEDPADDFFTDIFNALFVESFKYTTTASWVRVQYDSATSSHQDIVEQMKLHKRENGEIVLPYFRFDYHYQNIESDVDASDLRVIVGYGPIAFSGRKTFLREDEPFDKLRIDQFYGVLRLTLTDYVELGLGLGEYRLVGDETHSNSSFTMPLTVRINKNIGLEFIPAWTKINGNKIDDYDVGVLIGIRYASIKTGYRWIESPTDHLRGPYIGMSLFF